MVSMTTWWVYAGVTPIDFVKHQSIFVELRHHNVHRLHDFGHMPTIGTLTFWNGAVISGSYRCPLMLWLIRRTQIWLSFNSGGLIQNYVVAGDG